MIRDANGLDHEATIDADVCIAGAGAAGITLAHELRNSGWRVCLLEAGGLEHDVDDLQAFYSGTSVGIPLGDLTGCRLRYFGGTTGHWAGWCRPLEPEVFEPRSWLPDSGWPLSSDELRPFYERAQRTCELGAFEYDASALSERLGHSLLAEGSTMVETVPFQISPPTRFGTTYREDLDASEDVTVYLHANLTHISTDIGGERVEAYHGRTLAGVTFTVTARHYVLALGGIENARMLLASRDRRPEGVGNAHDLVGRYFAEHPHLSRSAFALFAPADFSFYRPHWVDTFDNDGQAYRARVFGALSLTAEVRAQHELLPMSSSLREFTLADADEMELTGPLTPSRLRSLLAATSNGLTLMSLETRTEQSPIPGSRVRLSDDLDPLGLPRVELDWRLGEDDLANIKRSLQIMGAALGRAGLARVWIPMDADGAYTPPRIAGGCHHMGTTRMSERRDKGVVDADCRVHDCPNLFIAGSSVFPTSGHANPTLTIVALAHRLADHLESIL